MSIADDGRTGKGWTVRISVDVASVKPTHLKMLIMLEALCRDRSYCWASADTLAEMYGCRLSGGFWRLLAAMQDAGLISRRAITNGDGAGRVGTFLRRRLDCSRPVDVPSSNGEADLLNRGVVASSNEETHSTQVRSSEPPQVRG